MRAAASRLRALSLVVALLALESARAAAVDEAQVAAIASQLRCVVCQNLSVADSPSETAKQMRELIRERLAQGESPRQVVDYFVERYGEWVLLAPDPGRRPFNLVVWVVPFVALLGAATGVGLAARRWARRAPEVPAETPNAEERERVRLELERLRE
jgi:cytochrome c-type biogenesis protein CcmH